MCVCVCVCVCVHTRACMCMHAHAKSLQLCLTLCNPMDCNPPGSPVHGILQARIPEWVAIPSYRESSNPGIESASLMSPALAGWFFTTSTTWEAHIYLHINLIHLEIKKSLVNGLNFSVMPFISNFTRALEHSLEQFCYIKYK